MSNPKEGSIRIEESNLGGFRIVSYYKGEWIVEEDELTREEALDFYSDAIVDYKRENDQEIWKVIETWDPDD